MWLDVLKVTSEMRAWGTEEVLGVCVMRGRGAQPVKSADIRCC